MPLQTNCAAFKAVESLAADFVECLSRCWLCRADPRSGQSSCKRNPAAMTDKEFLRIADRNVAALNAAVATLPADRMRLHICWGNYEGPHTHDIPLAKIIDICFKARPAGSSFEAANPRHEHEWEDLKQTRIPDDKVRIPG